MDAFCQACSLSSECGDNQLPALRERRRHIRPWQTISRSAIGPIVLLVFQRALWLLENYDWPGNIRELENAVVRAAALCDHVVRAEDLPERVRRRFNPEESGTGRFGTPVLSTNLPYHWRQSNTATSCVSWPAPVVTKQAAARFWASTETLQRKLERYDWKNRRVQSEESAGRRRIKPGADNVMIQSHVARKRLAFAPGFSLTLPRTGERSNRLHGNDKGKPLVKTRIFSVPFRHRAKTLCEFRRTTCYLKLWPRLADNLHQQLRRSRSLTALSRNQRRMICLTFRRASPGPFSAISGGSVERFSHDPPIRAACRSCRPTASPHPVITATGILRLRCRTTP